MDSVSYILSEKATHSSSLQNLLSQQFNLPKFTQSNLTLQPDSNSEIKHKNQLFIWTVFHSKKISFSDDKELTHI